jgi:hypothetical protein
LKAITLQLAEEFLFGLRMWTKCHHRHPCQSKVSRRYLSKEVDFIPIITGLKGYRTRRRSILRHVAIYGNKLQKNNKSGVPIKDSTHGFERASGSNCKTREQRFRESQPFKEPSKC